MLNFVLIKTMLTLVILDFYINLAIGTRDPTFAPTYLRAFNNWNVQIAIAREGVELRYTRFLSLLSLSGNTLTLQFAGRAYAWNSSQVIGLFCGFILYLVIFIIWQYRQGD